MRVEDISVLVEEFNGTIEFLVIGDRRELRGVMSDGADSTGKVFARCKAKNCQHYWRVRGIRSVRDLDKE